MTRTFLVVTLAVVASACGSEPKPACLDGQSPAPVAAVPDSTGGFHVFGHAHNDYEHERPLNDALDHGFYSVEADVWYDDGKLTVSHLGFGAKGTLKDLYLDPLQTLVTENGSVHGDGRPFTLWVDLKENKEGFVDALHTLFDGYPMLTSVSGDAVTEGAVTIALTGDKTAKEAFIAARADRRAFRDSNDYTPDDPPADSGWRFYALDWKKYLGWNGEGSIPADDSARMTCILANAHEDGRKVRFYGAPDREEAWDAALDHGLDYVHTDKLADLDAYLESRQ